jgi:ubiquinone/menaquinone biosynthesis C-methylase UbiE
MTADAKATLNKERLFAQHQAALTILQRELDSPKIKKYNWLDLACGKGQIIVHLIDNLVSVPQPHVARFLVL